MTRERQLRNAATRKAFSDLHGTDPIEAGVVGCLADHECRHGFLPSDQGRTCQCFPRRTKRGKR